MEVKNETLFRGKVRYGWWVYGDLVRVGEITSIVEKRMEFANPIRFHNDSIDVSCTIVDEKTVGQYVRFKDSEVDLIFEGDVVEMYHGSLNRDGTPEINYYLIDNIATVGDVVFMWGDVGKIIGNIHDNPEIMDKVENSGKYEESMKRVVDSLEKMYPTTKFKFIQSREDGDVVRHNNRELDDFLDEDSNRNLIEVFVDICQREGVDLLKKSLAICYDFSEEVFPEVELEKADFSVFGDEAEE